MRRRGGGGEEEKGGGGGEGGQQQREASSARGVLLFQYEASSARGVLLFQYEASSFSFSMKPPAPRLLPAALPLEQAMSYFRNSAESYGFRVRV